MLDKTSADNPLGRHMSNAFLAQTIHAERKARRQQSAKVLRQFESRGNDRLSGLPAGPLTPTLYRIARAVKRKTGLCRTPRISGSRLVGRSAPAPDR